MSVFYGPVQKLICRVNFLYALFICPRRAGITFLERKVIKRTFVILLRITFSHFHCRYQ